MKPFERLGEARAPDGTLLTLHRHDGSYILRVNGVELMSTRRSNSEVRLAQVACVPLQQQPGVRVLIGGLGLGFTLVEALRLLASDAVVVVAEIVREVIEWNREPSYALAGAAMEDPRVDVRHDDVANVMREAPGGYDAILLDVDNGAECLTTAGNAHLYADVGIRQAVSALRPNGVLAYWSAEPDPRFVKALHRAGMQVETQRVRAHVTFGGFHTLLFARRRDAGSTTTSPRPRP